MFIIIVVFKSFSDHYKKFKNVENVPEMAEIIISWIISSGANVAAAAFRTRMEPGGGRCGGGGAGCVGGDLCSLGGQPQAICVHDLDVDIYTAIRRGHAGFSAGTGAHCQSVGDRGTVT